MTTMTIPAHVVGIVRSALHTELGQAALPHLKGAERQRRTATRYARAIEGFLPTVRARAEQIGGQ